MRQLAIHWLTPPVFEDERRTIAARLLNRILLTSFVICLVGLPSFMLFPSRRAFNVTMLSIWLVIIIIQLRLLHKGYVRAISWAFLITLWLTGLYTSHATVGVFAAHSYLFVVITLAAAILLGVREVVGFAVLSTVGLTLLLLNWRSYDVAAYYAADQMFQRAFAVWNINILVLAISATFIIYAANNINRALTRLQQSEAQLSRRNAELEVEIAERKRIDEKLRSSEELFRQIFDLAPIGMATFDREGLTLQGNKALANMLGYEQTELIGQTGYDWTHPEDISPNRELLPKLFANKSVVVVREFRLFHKQGHVLNASVTLSPVTDANGDPSYAIAMIEDITELKKAEENRVALQLERERLSFLREFTSQMTHDLKSPLTTIGMSTYLLQNQDDDTAKKRHADQINRQIEYLSRMIDNILLVSRLDHMPDLDLQTLNPNQIITQIEDRLRPQMDDKQHTVHLELDASLRQVMADLDEFDRALTNLIQNAIKYTPEGGTITVATRTKADQVEIEIADTGIGIGADDLPHIFERFYRTDSGKRTNRGTGLGLAIVKRIVALHNGTIDVHSVEGEGTTFTLRFAAAY